MSKNRGSNNKRSDGCYGTPRVHINSNGQNEKLKIDYSTGKAIYRKTSDNSIVPKKKTCNIDEAVNGRVERYKDEDYFGERNWWDCV